MNDSSKTKPFILEWHAAATHNKAVLESAGGGTCGNCKVKLDVNELDWVDDTGQCSECGVDCVIPESVLVGASPEMLEEFRLYWFEGRLEFGNVEMN